MTDTIVIQSHRTPLQEDWLQTCLDSVKFWAKSNKFDYIFIDDKLFDYVSANILQKTKSQRVVATDLARLKVLQQYLKDGYETVVWCDADFIIFSPEKFILPTGLYAVGREVWIQKDTNSSHKLVAKIKVHNAFMMFSKKNTFLDFYAEVAERLVMNNEGSMPPQFIGPKLLTAIHNVIQCPVLESAGMLSPLVVKDIAEGEGEALNLFRQKSTQNVYAANVCNSLFERREYSAKTIKDCLMTLMREQTV